MFWILSLLLMFSLSFLPLLCSKPSKKSNKKSVKHRADPVGPAVATPSVPVLPAVTPPPLGQTATPGLSPATENSSNAVEKHDKNPQTPREDKSGKKKQKIKEPAPASSEDALRVDPTMRSLCDKNSKKNDLTKENTQQISAKSNHVTLAASKDGASEREGSAQWFKSVKNSKKPRSIEDTQKSRY